MISFTIIEKTEIYIPSDNSKALQRIKISLQAINLNGIELDEEEISFDYTKQDELFQEIINKKEMIDGYKRILERAKEINPSAKDKLESIDLNKENMFNEDEFIKELANKFTTKQRTQMKMCKLDNYCLFIASRYFDTLADHIN